MTVGPLEAYTAAVGEQLTELAGHRMTRLTANVAKGATTFPVESTFGWPTAGEFFLDGIRYSYTGITPVSVTGVTWPDVGIKTSGNLDAAADTVVLTTVNGTQARISLAGDWLGTIQFEGSVDGTVWAALAFTPLSGGAPVTSTQANGSWAAAVGSNIYVRVRASTWAYGLARAKLNVWAGLGAFQDHAVTSVLVDFSRTYSALDRLKSQLVVETAEGAYLDVVGRNLGVNRPPNLSVDDSFRAVIQAMAYAPLGTMFAIEQALQAFLGAENVRVFENIPTYRNTVFVELLNGIALSLVEQGQTYLGKKEDRPMTGGNQLTLTGTLLTVQGVQLAPEDRADILSATLPSGLTEIRYSGDAGAPVWTFGGTLEADVTMVAGQGANLSNPGGRTTLYHRTARIRPESRAAFTATVYPGVTLPSAVDGRQVSINLRDGARDIAAGFFNAGGTNVTVAFIDAAGAAIGPASAVLPGANFHDVSIIKNGDTVELRVDNVLVSTQLTTAFPATVLNEFRWGHQVGALACLTTWKVLAIWAETLTDYWNDRGAAAAVNVGLPDTLDTNSASIQAGDVGKALRTYGASNVKNNGYWLVDTRIDADNVTLVGVTHPGAYVESGVPGRVSLAHDPEAFRFPEDVGKRLELLTGPDAGVYTITALLDDAGAALTSPGRAGKAVVSGAPVTWTTAAGLDWRLLPNFATESPISWEIAAVGTVAGLTLTMRTPPPLNIPGGYVVILRASYTQVKSGQLLADPIIPNAPAGEWWPAYLPQHPLGPYAALLDDLTVAGVIPELIVR